MKMRIHFYYGILKLRVFPDIADRISETSMTVTEAKFGEWKNRLRKIQNEAKAIAEKFEKSNDGKRFRELVIECQEIMKTVKNSD